MKNEDDLRLFIQQHAEIVRVLKIVEGLPLPDCWVGGGFIRNAVWDELHNFPFRSMHQDIDIIFFDRDTHDDVHSLFLENELSNQLPEENWSIKNQFLMQPHFGQPEYTCSEDGMRHWPEICTAIAARVKENSVELLLPYGARDLLDLVVRPTPYFQSNSAIIRQRATIKQWKHHWPKLLFHI